MFKRSLPSPAMIIACLALFVAMGGTGYAATQLSSNQEGAVASKGKGSKRGPRGRRGPKGATGPAGPAGAPGKDAFGQLDYNIGESVPNPKGKQTFVEVLCDPGFHPVGGGLIGSSSSLGQDINGSFPLLSETDATGWAGYIDNNTGSDSSVTAYVVCAKAGSVTVSF